jgi:hypothetical protein
MQTSNKNHPIFLELCAGSAVLSKTMQSSHIFAIPVDHDRNSHVAKVPTVKLDLADAAQVAVILDLVDSGSLAAVWAAVPCGTCSRAREIPIPGNRFAPKPLRSNEYPRGFPWLQGVDLERVCKANKVYDHVFLIFMAVLQKCPDCLLFVENPRNSILWLIPEYRDLVKLGFVDVDFHHCRWSVQVPSRKKWTRLRCSSPAFLALAGVCNQTHKHLEWGQRDDGTFVTAGESEYPQAMCDSIAALIVSELQRIGWTIPEKNPEQILNDLPNRQSRLAIGRQPKGRRAPNIVSEFGQVLTLPPDTPTNNDAFRVLRYITEGGDTGNVDNFPVAGFWRSPSEFISVAQDASHPMDNFNPLPKSLVKALVFNLESPKDVIADNLLTSIKQLAKLIQDTASEEDRLHSKFESLSSKILSPKKFTAMKNLLTKHSDVVTDVNIVDDIIQGFSLIGWEPFHDAFTFHPDPPQTPVESVAAISRYNNESLLSRTISSGNESDDKALWDAALEEVSNGWLVGPFYESCALQSFVGAGKHPHLSRRFPIQQSGKLRAIDDFSESSINLCHGTYDKLWLMDGDFVGAVIKTIQQAVTFHTGIIVDSEGNQHNVNSTARPWSGTTVDLKSAYKQLTVNPTSRWASCISIYNPTLKVAAMFGQVSLPFGSSASVLAFNRSARFVWQLLVSELRVVILNYFDDYPLVAPKEVADLTHHAVKLFMKMLGWTVAEADKKDVPMAEHFTALGIKFNMSRILEGLSLVENVQKRTEDMIKLIESCRNKKGVTKHESEVIRGRLQFMESQLFGRAGKSFLFCFSGFGSHPPKWSAAMDTNFLQLINWLKCVRPRPLDCLDGSPPVLLFTDGACEDYLQDDRPPKVSMGALLIDRLTSTRQYFSEEVSAPIVQHWLKQGKRQLVTEAELLPVLISKLQWPSQLYGRKALVFIDSEPARNSLVKGSSFSESCNEIVRAVHICNNTVCSFDWFARVPTKSNPADAASRGNLLEMEQTFNATRVFPIQDLSQIIPIDASVFQ